MDQIISGPAPRTPRPPRAPGVGDPAASREGQRADPAQPASGRTHPIPSESRLLCRIERSHCLIFLRAVLRLFVCLGPVLKVPDNAMIRVTMALVLTKLFSQGSVAVGVGFDRKSTIYGLLRCSAFSVGPLTNGFPAR